MKNKIKTFVFLWLVFVPLVSYSKVYIDITSPVTRRLPIAFKVSEQSEEKEISGIIKDDLEFTGIFSNVDPDVPGAEILVNMKAELTEDKIVLNINVMDFIENREILKKIYEAKKDILRTLSHSISNDIYKIVTGREGIFRTKLAYLVDVSGRKELHLMDWDGYNSHKIIKRGFAVNHNWSSDSKYIVYSSEVGRQWNISLYDMINYKEKILFSSKGLSIVGGFSGKGEVVFSSSMEGSPEIYKLNVNDSKYVKLTKSVGIDVSPVFSPDGTKIAFVSDRGGGPQIYTMDVDGSSVKRITFNGSYNTSPVWSPDGNCIAYAGRKDGNTHIFMIKLDTGEIKQITDKGNNDSPTFSPDGMFIAFDSERNGTKGIYVMNINGNMEKRVTPKDVKTMIPRWSNYIK